MGLSSEARIPKLWDTSVPVINGTYTDTVCSLPHHGPGETVSVAGHCTEAYYFAVRAGIEVEAKAHKPRLQGPRGVSSPLHLRLSLQISRLFKVLFYSLVYGQEYCLIMVHLILLLLHHV